jgi:hypothetical protein
MDMGMNIGNFDTSLYELNKSSGVDTKSLLSEKDREKVEKVAEDFEASSLPR